jgi:deazaflavin-dependent oxidoreductase (nitroreductase family)
MAAARNKARNCFWRLIRQPPQLAYALGLGPFLGRFMLLLTTTGRKSGLARVTPLQYEQIDGLIYVASARGPQADWFRNIQAQPEVVVQMGTRRFRGQAEPITDQGRIADFLELRLRRRPRTVGALLRLEGLPREATREQLEALAAKRPMVIIHPTQADKSSSD